MRHMIEKYMSLPCRMASGGGQYPSTREMAEDAAAHIATFSLQYDAAAKVLTIDLAREPRKRRELLDRQLRTLSITPGQDVLRADAVTLPEADVRAITWCYRGQNNALLTAARDMGIPVAAASHVDAARNAPSGGSGRTTGGHGAQRFGRPAGHGRGDPVLDVRDVHKEE